MAEVRRQDKQLKRDHSVSRDVRNDVADQMRDVSDTKPIIKHPNRDQARGDWDRTGSHHDEGKARD
jgi:hypothetical protein